MSVEIANIALGSPHDVVLARRAAREVARLLGFDQHDQTRIAIAVSELARHAFEDGESGEVDYLVQSRHGGGDLVVCIRDRSSTRSQDARAIARVKTVRQLMDAVNVSSAPGGGTTTVIRKAIPQWSESPQLESIRTIVASARGDDPLGELRRQNQELVLALEALKARQDELNRLNSKLAESNRGVVALYTELDERVKELRHANEAKSRFLAGASHELRTPLTAMLALSDLLLSGEEGKLSEEQTAQMMMIQDATESLIELVDELLDLGRIDAGRLELKLGEVDVKNLFAALRGMFRALPKPDEVELEFGAARNLPRVISDEAKLTRILSNLISNALKFTERGRVRVTASAKGDEVVFTVTDTGAGIAPGDQARVFEEFVSIGEPVGERRKGSGLGLAVSRRLSSALGGSLSVASEVGVGSEFRLVLPILGPSAALDRERAPTLSAGVGERR